MSQFERGAAGQQVIYNARRTQARLPGTDPRQILPDVAGLAVTPVVQDGPTMAVQLMQALGVGGDIVQGIAADRERAAARAEREAARTQAEQDRQRRVLEGLGQDTFARVFPEVVDEIGQGTEVLDNAQIQDRASQILSTRLSGLDPEAIKGAEQQFGPQIVRAMVARRDELRTAANTRLNDLELTRASFGSADDIKAIGASLEQRDPLTYGDGRGVRAAAARALQSAAAVGDEARVKELAPLAENPVLVAQAQNTLQQIKNEKDAADGSAFAADVSVLRDRARAGLLRPEDVEAIARNNPLSTPERMQRIVEPVVDSLITRREAEAARFARDQAEAQKVQAIQGAEQQLSDLPAIVLDYEGGVSNLVGNWNERTIPGAGENGKDLKISVNKQEAISAAVEGAFAEIDRTTPDTAANLTAKLDLLRNQNGAATYAPWQAALSRPMSVARPGLTPQDVPPDAVASYSLYLAMRQQGGPDVLRSHTSEQTLAFNKLVELDQTHRRRPGGGGPTVAESIAAVANIDADRSIARRVPDPDTAEQDVVTARAESIAKELGLDKYDVRDRIKSRLEYQWRMLGYPAYSAASVEEAARSFREDYSGLDGETVYIRDIPNWNPSMPALAQDIRGVLATELNVNPEAVRFTIRESGELALRDLASLPIPGTPILTTDDLAAIASKLSQLDLARKGAEGLRNRNAAAAQRGEPAGSAIATPAGPVVPRSFFRLIGGVNPQDTASADAFIARAESGEGLTPDAVRVFRAILNSRRTPELSATGPSIATPAGPVIPLR
jgi:hypothetical protein